ncbi:unnamed protein product [Clonostachys byssicola]|uniref:Uncharacterized protein n=1 Tax=Clonostachys byssicola TaxID=160290 RepID=A0A9N9U6P0_9HYPO|nr:unnamed protein product [Clonostachys byssicola]
MPFSTHAEYDLTKDPQAVPQFLLDALVLTIDVEFLELSSKGVAATAMNNEENHVVLKFSLLDEYQGLITVRLDMRIDDSCKSTEADNLGKLIIYTLDLEREYTSSARTCAITLTEVLKFEEIILNITESGLQHFQFAHIDDSIQVLHLLKAKDHIAISYINRALGQRYTREGIFECPIDKGRFRTYERQETNDMPYATRAYNYVLRMDAFMSS